MYCSQTITFLATALPNSSAFYTIIRTIILPNAQLVRAQIVCNRSLPRSTIVTIAENHPNNQLFCSFHLLALQMLLSSSKTLKTLRNPHASCTVWTRGKEISIKQDMRHLTCCRTELICRPSTTRPRCICSGSPRRIRPSTDAGWILRRRAHVILWSS